METTTSLEKVEKTEKQKQYETRVQNLFADIINWLPQDLTTVQLPPSIMPDEPEECSAYGLAIVKKNIPEPDNAVADLMPSGCSVLLAEGGVDLDGPYGEERIVYLVKSNILRLPRKGASRPQPMFKGVDQDGWYWLEDPRRSRMLPMHKTLLLDLLEMVSGYEP